MPTAARISHKACIALPRPCFTVQAAPISPTTIKKKRENDQIIHNVQGWTSLVTTYFSISQASLSLKTNFSTVHLKKTAYTSGLIRSPSLLQDNTIHHQHRGFILFHLIDQRTLISLHQHSRINLILPTKKGRITVERGKGKRILRPQPGNNQRRYNTYLNFPFLFSCFCFSQKRSPFAQMWV